jgi:hypothetical protein
MWHISIFRYLFIYLSLSLTLPTSSFRCRRSTLHLITLNDMHTQSVGVLRASDKPVAQTSTWQHTDLAADRYPCSQQRSKPKYEKASGPRYALNRAGTAVVHVTHTVEKVAPKHVYLRVIRFPPSESFHRYSTFIFISMNFVYPCLDYDRFSKYLVDILYCGFVAHCGTLCRPAGRKKERGFNSGYDLQVQSSKLWHRRYQCFRGAYRLLFLVRTEEIIRDS